MARSLIALTSLPNPMRIDGIALTPAERVMGRLMRAPDGHDGGDAGGEGGGDAATGDSGAAADATGDTAGEATGGDPDGKASDATTLVGKAAAKPSEGEGGEGGEGDEGDDGKKADPEGPPEAYDLALTIKAEDGTETPVAMDPVLVEAATPILKDLGLTNDQANKVLPLVPQIQQQALKAQSDAFETMATDWAKQVKADPEIGGKNWPTTDANMGRALDKFGSPELTDLLEQSRLGNHPAFVRVFNQIGAAMGEDFQFPRGNPKAEKLPREAVLYPADMPKEQVKK